jgi:hypothetical protein
LHKIGLGNSKRYSLSGQILGLFPRDHQFEFHKSQDHWRLTWSLTS